MSTRGIRNNNPSNIRKGGRWKGLRATQTDKEFCQFESMLYGVRALIKLLQTYVITYKCKSIRAIITRWAPPSDGNQTEAYIRFCLQKCSICFNDTEEYIGATCFDKYNAIGKMKLFELCSAMCWMESGYKLDFGLFDEALYLL